MKDTHDLNRHEGLEQDSIFASDTSAMGRSAQESHELCLGGLDVAMLSPKEHVLSTLEQDGSRRWIYPQLAMGKLWRRRRRVAFVLASILVLLPHLKVAGKQAVLLDVAARKFTILGRTFLATDTFLLVLGMLFATISVMLITAIGGRLWCGWACPQTVFMEFFFRPIDRFFEGTTGKGGKPKRSITGSRKLLRWFAYLAVSTLLAHTFLSYFVGVESLGRWILTPPWEHPIAFLIMGTTTALMVFHFLYFREQLCLIACPYGRFQSVMLDRRSCIVAYDSLRGEPRRKGSRRLKSQVTPDASQPGDCIDCNRCVSVCPTGIDIRNGLQLECINCGQCIDACDEVMHQISLPNRLIRYDSQDGIAGQHKGALRTRTIVYPIILICVGSLFCYLLSSSHTFDARLIRALGSPFIRAEGGLIRNSFRIRLVNRSTTDRTYKINAITPADTKLSVIDPLKLTIASNESSLVPILIEFPPRVTSSTGNSNAIIEIADDLGDSIQIDFLLVGPKY